MMMVLGIFALPSQAQRLQLVSLPDPLQGAPAGGSGDSLSPLLSPDGRYVLFASTADNLLLLSNSTVMPSRFPTVLNVFLRDRTNGTTSLLSINSSGAAGGNGDSLPLDLSTNGQYALFESSASDLVPGDTNNATDVFIRDLAGTSTILVSANTNGLPGNAASHSAAMTPDGRYVAFVSAASDLVPSDTNGIPDMFLWDLQSGQTTLVSVGAKSTSASYPGGSSESPVITPDGRYVAFQSTATNLVPGVPASGDVYVRDLLTSNTIWASIGARVQVYATFHTSNAFCYNQQITADGQFVAYEASPNTGGQLTSGIILRYSLVTGLTDLVDTNAAGVNSAYEDFRSLSMTTDGRFIAYIGHTNGGTGATTCVRLWDANTATTTVISGDLSNNVPVYSTCHSPLIDSTGQFVTFLSSATNMTTNVLVGTYHIYRRDLAAQTTTLLDADMNGVGSPLGPATRPALSADGRFVAFECPDANLVPGDRNHCSDVFVRDLVSGGAELISPHDPALPSATPNGESLLATTAVSPDGRYLAFASEADNLAPGDTNGCRDVFVRDLWMGTNVLASVATNGFSGDSVSTDPSISRDGRFVAFTSLADNLVSGDTNRVQDVFVRDLQNASTTLISVNRNGTGPGNKNSYAPMLGSTGRYLLFRSIANDLVAGIFSGENLFWRDLLTVSNRALTSAGLVSASMTPDARYVAYADNSAASAGDFYVWDSQAAAGISTNTTLPGLTNLAISPDGGRIACWTSSGGWSLSVFDRAANTNWTVATGVSIPARPSLRFSASADRLAYTAVVSGTNQVFLYDFANGTNVIVSTSLGSSTGASGASDSADISGDGRFVAYRSVAPDIVAGATNGWPQVFLYDSQTGSNTLLSASLSGTIGENNRSLAPVFSRDGQTLFFPAAASDLTARDFNHDVDLFGFTLFYATIQPGPPGSNTVILSWPWVPNVNYRVDYKQNVTDNIWHDLGGTVTHVGNRAYLQDPSPTANQRFYRIVAF
jgi:Tol biopolymer transport system component